MSSFAAGFQRAILRLAMIDEAFTHQAMSFLSPAFFTTEASGWIFTTMKRYHDTYSMRCTEIPLRDALRYAPADQVVTYSAEIDAVVLCGEVPEAEYIKAELTEFCKRNLFTLAHKESATFYNAGKHEEAYALMRASFEQMEKLSFANEDRQWFFEEFDERQRIRYRESLSSEANAFSTGIPLLDEATDGGAHPGEMWLILAYAKIGKTTWICNQLFNAVRMHRQMALHIQLEGLSKQTAAKYDALFSNELYANVRKGDFQPATLRELQAEYARLRGLLVIRALTEWDTNILHVDAEFKLLKAQGKTPRVVGLDYVDLLRSRHKRDSETQHQIDSCRDAKLFAMRRMVALHTASQAVRPKDTADEFEHVLKAANIADAYAKVRVADFIGSLNATREEREKNEMRFFAELHRDNPMGRLYTLQNDISRMRMAKTSAAKRIAKTGEDEDEFGGASLSATPTSLKGGRRGKRLGTGVGSGAAT